MILCRAFAVFSISWMLLAPGARASERCFAKHLQDAIHLNIARSRIYRELSDGLSEQVSALLIMNEMFALLPAASIDDRARSYQEKGIAIGCDEFVSMDLAPEVPRERGTALPIPALLKEDPAIGWSQEISKAYRAAGFSGAHEAARSALQELKEYPEFFCMARHLLESIDRVSVLAPRHELRAKELGLDSPRSISETLMELHLFSLAKSGILDRRAAKLQSAGIPIICSDVPPIETSISHE